MVFYSVCTIFAVIMNHVKYLYSSVAAVAGVIIMVTSSCQGNKQEKADATSKKVDTVETVAKQAPEQEAKTKNKAEADNGFPSTYEQPKATVLDVLKEYNANMSDYNTTGVEALGMGSQGNCVLLNFSVSDINFSLGNKTKLKEQARELIKSMPIDRQTAWRCIPNEGYDLMVTFVGRQSSKIVSVVFTKEELKEMLE